MLLVLVVAPGPARAGKKEDAKAHIAKATRAHKDGRFEEARVELEAAYALDPIPDLLFAIGQVHAKLGQCDEATTYFTRFAATQKDPQVAKVIEQAIAACTPGPAAGAAPPPDSARPPADSAPPPDKLTTADRSTPVPDRPTDRPTDKPIDRPAGKPAPVASRPPPPAHGVPAPAQGDARSRSPWYKDKLGDGLVIGGVVATVVGLVEYTSARSDLDAAEDMKQTATLTRYHDLVDSAHSKRAVSVVFLGAGGALITAGIVHYVLHDRATEVRAIGIAPAHGGGVVTYEGSF